MVNRLFVELAGTCVARCPSCALPTDAALAPTQYGEVFEAARRVGFDFIGVLGRQPLAQPASEEVLRRAVDTGAQVRVYTTLLGGTGPETAPSLAGRVEVTVLLWGARAAHDRATGVQGSFDDALEAAARWQLAGSSVLVKVPATTTGLRDLPEVAAAAQGLDLPLLLTPWWPVAYGKGAALRPPHPAVLASLFTQSPEFKGFAYTPTAQVCKAGRARAFIDAEFNLYSCFESRVAVANMITEDFSAVWTDDDRWGPWRRSALAQLSQCGSCDLQRGCHICPAPEFDGRGATCSSRQLAVARETTAVLRRQDWEA